MIVSDTEKFVFVHNPKCGGMSCHNTLLAYDTRENFFFEWKQVGDQGKTLDMAHITPFQMRRFFPKAFRDTRDYLKFTFVRNPYTRFMSAISQHLKLGTPHMRKAILNDADAFYRVAASFAVTSLRIHPVENDHKLVHFRPQVNFTNIDGRRWVDHAFRLEDPAATTGTPVTNWLPDLATKTLNQSGGVAENGYDIARLGPDAISALNTFYARDFEAFDYERL